MRPNTSNNFEYIAPEEKTKFYLFYFYIYSPDSQESDGVANT